MLHISVTFRRSRRCSATVVVATVRWLGRAAVLRAGLLAYEAELFGQVNLRLHVFSEK